MARLLVSAAAAMLAGLGAASSPAHAQQGYPSRPITMVVALPAGGGVDALARVIADHMRVTLGQPIIVENMGGAGGTLSSTRVVRSAPDGYTIGMGTLSQYVVATAVYNLPFDILTNDKLEAARTGNWFLETDLAIARLDKLSRAEMEELVFDAWRMVVPKKVAAEAIASGRWAGAIA